MVKILKQENPWAPNCGGVLYGKNYFAGEVTEDMIDKVVYPNAISNDIWKALKKLNIDCEDLKNKVEYECFITTGNTHYWFIPSFLLITGEHNYPNQGHINDMLFDYEWSKQFSKDRWKKPNQIEQTFLGHGYTLFTSPYDGSNEVKIVYSEMDNGDKLCGYVWVWYNK